MEETKHQQEPSSRRAGSTLSVFSLSRSSQVPGLLMSEGARSATAGTAPLRQTIALGDLSAAYLRALDVAGRYSIVALELLCATSRPSHTRPF
jgi:hypothetical protein